MATEGHSFLPLSIMHFIPVVAKTQYTKGREEKKMNSSEKIEVAEKHLLWLPFPHSDNRYFPLRFSCDGEIDSLCYVTHKKPHDN